MAGQKRTRNGQVKPPSNNEPSQSQTHQAADATMTEPTPSCGQPQLPSSKSTQSHSIPASIPNTKEPPPVPKEPKPSNKPTQHLSKATSSTTRTKTRQKLPRLPNSASYLPLSCLKPPCTRLTNSSRCYNNQATPPPPRNPHPLRILILAKNPLHNRHHALHPRAKTRAKTPCGNHKARETSRGGAG